MVRQGQAAAAARVKRLGRQIEKWRANRQKRGPMPIELWDEAVDLGREHGAYRIAEAVGIKYDRLRAKIEAALSQAKTTAEFVEAPTCGFGDAGALQQVRIELARGDGTRLVVQMSGPERLDILGLASIVLGRP